MFKRGRKREEREKIYKKGDARDYSILIFINVFTILLTFFLYFICVSLVINFDRIIFN